MAQDAVAIPGFLVCDVVRRIDRRILLDFEQLAEIDKIFREIHSFNLAEADQAMKKVIGDRFPAFEIKLSDGASYKVKTLNEVGGIRTCRDRRIEKITITSWGDKLKANLQLGEKYGSAGTVSIDGPEDKAEHYANKIERIVREKSDFTVLASSISSFIYAMLFAALVFFTLVAFIGFFIKPTAGQAGLLAVFVLAMSFASLLGAVFYIDSLKDRWLPKASFLWGYGERQHQLARGWIKAIFLSFPVWATSLVLPLFLGK